MAKQTKVDFKALWEKHRSLRLIVEETGLDRAVVRAGLEKIGIALKGPKGPRKAKAETVETNDVEPEAPAPKANKGTSAIEGRLAALERQLASANERARKAETALAQAGKGTTGNARSIDGLVIKGVYRGLSEKGNGVFGMGEKGSDHGGTIWFRPSAFAPVAQGTTVLVTVEIVK